MKRLGAVLILIVALLPLQSIPANAGVADCLSIGYPSVSSTSSSINVTVSIQVNCTKEQIGSSRGAVLSIVEEGTFGPTCSGLYSLSPGGSQSISCSIPLTGGFASIRNGATSSTIRVWFAWDFSTKFITFRHIAIPGKSIGGTSSGTTAGNTGGTTSGTAVGGVLTPITTESLLYAQEAIDAANAATDAANAGAESVNKITLAAQKAADAVAALATSVDELILLLKKQIELLNKFMLKIKAKG
jgi:hypothetical protein